MQFLAYISLRGKTRIVSLIISFLNFHHYFVSENFLVLIVQEMSSSEKVIWTAQC